MQADDRETLLAKITPPRLAGVVPRKRLCERIERADGRIVWLSGLAGTGKTTLAAEYVAYKEAPCLWYQLDSGDSEQAAFFQYMRLALKRVRPRVRHLPPLFTPECAGSMELFTRRYFEKLFSLLCADRHDRLQAAILVLEDFQNVQDPAFHELIRVGLNVVPESMSVLVLSRQDPPGCLARLRAVNAMTVVDGRELLFTEAETTAFINLQPRAVPSDTSVQSIHAMTNGWPAGVRLLTGALSHSPHTVDSMEIPRDTIFDFFQEEIFTHLTPLTREFLLKTALLPSMTPRLAQALTGHPSSANLLRRMAASNFFVVRHQGQERTYSYHQLLRDFLLAQGERIFSADQLTLLRRNAAAILRDGGRPRDAAELYILGGEGDLLADLIETQARTKLAQGRRETVRRWLEHVPERIKRHRPWLGYWSALIIPPWKVQEKSPLLEKAIEGFMEQGDRQGLCLARAELIIDCLVDLGISAAAKRHFLLLCADMDANLSFPDLEVEARVVLGLIVGGTFSHPGHPSLGQWVERGVRLLHAPIPLDLKINIGMNLQVYSIYMGDMLQAERVYLQLKPLAEHAPASDQVRLQWRVLQAMYLHLIDPRPELCRQAVQKGLELADATGIHAYDMFLLAVAAYMAVTSGDRDALARAKQRLAPLMPLAPPLGRINYQCMLCCEQLDLGNGRLALQHGRLALETLPRPRSPLPTVLILIGMAEACIEDDNWPQARSYLKQARQITLGISAYRGEVMFLIPVAYAAFRRGREGVGLRVLNIALARARAGRWLNGLYCRPSQLALICAKALEAGLETEYVRTLIQRHALGHRLPDSLHGYIPPNLEIRTLGGLRILRDGRLISGADHGAGKPLALLKALIVLGPENVPEEAILDVLWPDVDGDKAAQSLKFTVHALRKKLGVPKAVTVKGRVISLNPRVCGVDVTDFAQACARADKAWKEGVPLAEQVALCVAAVEKYQGDFLAKDPTVWLEKTRNRLKELYLQVRARLDHLQEQNGPP